MSIFTATSKKFTAPSELMPAYGRHVTERIVALDNERLMGVVVLQGIPFETTPDDQLQRAFTGLTKVFTELNKVNAPNLSQWNHIIKRKVSIEFDYKFTNVFAGDFAAKYLEQFKSGNFFKTYYAISFIYKHDDAIDQGIEKLDQLLDFALLSLKRYEPAALSVADNENGIVFSEVAAFLALLLNGHEEVVPLSSTRLVDNLLTSTLHFGHDLAEIRPASGGKKYATYFDLREFPDESKRGMWNFLLSEPVEFVLTQSFLHFTAMKSLSELDKQTNKLESGTNSPAHYIQDLKDARSFVSAGDISFGEYHAALVVYGATPKESQDNGNSLVTNFIAGSGARFIRATASGVFSYFSMMPGATDKPLSEPKTTRNLACGFSLNNYPSGKQFGNPIGDGSALLPLKTLSDSVFFLNTHYSNPAQDVRGHKIAGHFMILGATGTGKTTLEGVMVNFLTRFNPKIFAIDFNRSMQLMLEVYGAEYFDIDDGTDTGLNPFQLNDSPKLRSFLYQLLAACGRDEHGRLSAEDEAKCKACVDIIMGMNFEDRRFSYVSSIIPPEGGNSLGDRLAKWQVACNGSLAWALDSPVNRFNPGTMDRVGFNTTSILKPNHPAAEAILSVLFHMKEMMQIDGRLFLTLVEEFWVPCNFPTTQQQIMGSLKAGRIKNEFIGLVSQSPEDAVQCAIFPAIVQQTPTKIYLPNPDGNFEQYRQCGLNEKEFHDLHNLDKESRTFLVKQSQQSTFAKLDLYGYDDFLPIISGTWDSIQLAHAIRAEVGNDPANWVPAFLARRKQLHAE